MRASNLVIGRGHEIDRRIGCVAVWADIQLLLFLPHYLGCRGGLADMAGTGTERPLRHELRPDARVSSRNGSEILYVATGFRNAVRSMHAQTDARV
jgi:hypothetical protein